MAAPAQTTERIDDLIVVRVDGSLSLADSKHIYQHMEDLLADRNYCLALFDLSRAAVPTPQSRQWISRWFKQHDASRLAIATWGTSLLVRTVNRMFDSAVSLLTGHPTPARHFASEPEAQAWLARRRKELQAIS